MWLNIIGAIVILPAIALLSILGVHKNRPYKEDLPKPTLPRFLLLQLPFLAYGLAVSTAHAVIACLGFNVFTIGLYTGVSRWGWSRPYMKRVKAAKHSKKT